MKCRWAPSLGELEKSSEEVWGTEVYDEKNDLLKDTIFFGLYGFPDFYQLWRHGRGVGIRGTQVRAKTYILWAGTDIVHFTNGYWLDSKGNIRIDATALAQWINENCESWCENEVEREALESVGITAQVCPSFLGNVKDYEIAYTHAQRPRIYTSVSGNNFDMYGWNIIEMIAGQCDVDFHLYGNTIPWESKHSNVFVHGRVPNEQMNEEVKHMQGALRLCIPDGFSEILAKSILWAQWPITWENFKYPYILGADGLMELVRIINSLKYKTTPNIEGREYYLKTLNRFPWNAKNN